MTGEYTAVVDTSTCALHVVCIIYMCELCFSPRSLCFFSAVLENHHVAKSFQLTQEREEVNIYQNLDRLVHCNVQ